MAEHYPSLLVAADDFSAVSALSLPVRLVAASGSEGHFKFTADDAAVSPEQLYLSVVGRLAGSDNGRAQGIELAAYWENRFGTEAPEEIAVDLSDETEARNQISEQLIGLMARSYLPMARRSTGFMRELGILRQQHEDLQSSFRDLERFVRKNRLVTSTPVTTLSPVVREVPITLSNGAQLTQLLPGGSTGLSDFELHFCHERSPSGVLHLSLFSPTAAQTIAVWEVPAEELHAGWRRFALERAMGPDMVDLTLSVSYQGSGEVKLSTSIKHPEDRFRPRLDDKIIQTLPALRLWRWISGAVTPVSAGSFLQSGGRNRMRRISLQTLRTTINVDNMLADLPVFETDQAIQIHVVPDKIACGIVPGIALPGTSRVQADLQTLHPDGPSVEYGLALFPESARPVKPGKLLDLDPIYSSGWVRLSSGEKGQVHVILPEPLSRRHDVYLMTRLPNGQKSNAFGWSTFANICLFL